MLVSNDEYLSQNLGNSGKMFMEISEIKYDGFPSALSLILCFIKGNSIEEWISIANKINLDFVYFNNSDESFSLEGNFLSEKNEGKASSSRRNEEDPS